MIAYRVEPAGQVLQLTDAVLAHFALYRQTGRRKEAGGQLFAKFDNSQTRIELATGPRRRDRRSYRSFTPDRTAERQEIRRQFKSGLHYVGDWHTHPEHIPKPSRTDIASLQDTFLKSRHRLASFVMIIVGREIPPQGLYVCLCSSTSSSRLAPISNGRGSRASRPR